MSVSFTASLEHIVEAIILISAVGLLTLLAVAAMRYGVDSRDGFASTDRNTTLRGFVWSR